MKTKYFLGLFVLLLVTIFSCKKELEPQESSSGTIPSANDSESNSSVPPSALLTNSTPSVPSPQQNTNLNAVTMNPPHGQSGHRCDIAVGAPLNSSPNKSIVKNSVSNSTLPTNVKSNAATVVTQPGMNPPHGQTGHRCDVAVGAPLNSTPNKSIVKNSVSKSTLPTNVKSNTAKVVTQPGMNPPHGQAGHRCDIEVGVPLNSLPTKSVPVPAVSNSEVNSQVPAVLKLDPPATSPK